MKEIIIQWLISNGVMVGVGVACAVAIFFARKNAKVKRITDMVEKAFILVEQAIPDDTQNKSLVKLDKGLKLFTEMYKQTFNTDPDATLIQWVKEMFAIIAKQNKAVKLV